MEARESVILRPAAMSAFDPLRTLIAEADNALSTHEMPRFVRFVCAQKHPTADGELGMFQARDRIDFSQAPGSIQRAHDEAWFWFRRDGGGGLSYPRLRGKARTQKVRKSVFWFREDARFFGHPKGSMINRARDLARAISAAGVEIREISVEDPGEIIWEDLAQVLALSDQYGVPCAFP